MSSIVWDPAKHPRHPSGSSRGGEWAPKVRGFGDKEFAGTWSKDPNQLVYDSFEPQTTGPYEGEHGFRVFPEREAVTARGGVWWKASYFEPTDALVIWTPDYMGGPHHFHVAQAMGWPTDSGIRDFENRMDIMGAGSGPGMTAELQWWDDDARLDNKAIARLREEMAKPSIQRQLREAEQLAREQASPDYAMAAAAARDFQAAWEAAQEDATSYYADLQRKWELVLQRARKTIVQAYRRSQDVLVAADLPAGSAGNVDPTTIVVDTAAVMAALTSDVEKVRREMQQAILAALTGEMQLVLDEARSYQALLGRTLEVQLLNTEAALRDTVRPALKQALDEGWSVPRTAEALNAQLADWAPWQATRLARTDLIAISNGTSIANALQMGPSAPAFKTWLTAGDEKVRPTHVEANRQTVPLDQPFDVGGSPMMFPGDPSAPDALTQNCRCTLVYGAGPHPDLRHSEERDELALSAAVWDPAKHPHEPAGRPEGGQWASTYQMIDYRHGEPEWWHLGTTARQEMRDDPDWKAFLGLEPVRGDPSGTREGRKALTYSMALEAFNAENVLVARQNGQIVGVLGYSLATQPDGIREFQGGNAGAIKGGGLPLFKGAVKIAAAEGAALSFQSTSASDTLYERLGIPPRRTPEGMEYDGEHYLTPEQVQLLSHDMFALARTQKLAAAADPWVEPELDWLVAAFDESKHPRRPKGSEGGGQFTVSVGFDAVKYVEDMHARQAERDDLLMQGLPQGNLVLADAIRHPDEQSDYYDPAVYGIVQEHGQAFEQGFEPIEPDEQWNKMGECFSNATHVVWDGEHPDWTYVEGFAYPEVGDMWMQVIGQPIHHAWLVTPEGKIYDPTWGNKGSAYVGVPVEKTYLYGALAERGFYGAFAEESTPPGPDDVVRLGRPIRG